jgi:hypothetical protein
MRSYAFMQESPDRDYFLPALLTSFILFAPIVGSCITGIAVTEAFQRMSSAGPVSLSVLGSYMGTALLWTAIGLILWPIGLGSYLFLTLKLEYKRVWFWRAAVASCILLLFSATIIVALPALLFLVFGRSRLLPGQRD